MTPDDRVAERLFWSAASPYMRLLGATVDDLGGGVARMRIAALPRIARAADDPRPDPLVLPGLADDCLGLAISQSRDAGIGLATLDLWLSFVRDPDGSPIVATAHALAVAGAAATARVEIVDDGGTLLVGATTFLTGHYPSGSTGNHDTAGRFDASRIAGPYAAATGLSRHASGARLTGSGATTGWEAGPSMHGGAVAALLCAAATQATPAGQRLVSIAIRYLRPVIGTDLSAEATLDRGAARASHVSVVATAAGRTTATAQAIFAP